jgi:hypothetical protein
VVALFAIGVPIVLGNTLGIIVNGKLMIRSLRLEESLDAKSLDSK